MSNETKKTEGAIPPSIPVTGWVVFSQGDPSVGIWNGEWRLTGEMWFDSKEELDEFREGLASLFELVTDPVTFVITAEEEKTRIAAEDAMWDALQRKEQP